MDWFYPNALLLILPGLALLFWFDLKSTHPMPAGRRRFLFLVRSLLLILAVVEIASPAKLLTSRDQSVLFLLDHSRSQGEAGMSAVYDTARSVSDQVDGSATVGYLATGEEGRLLLNPGSGGFPNLDEASALMDEIGASSNFERGFQLARGLFPGGSSRHLVLVGDGVETRGSLLEAAREAAIAGIKIHAIGVSGEIQPDVRVTRLTSSQSRLNEGASLELEAIIESSLSGPGRIRLFENGVEVEELSVDLVAGETLEQRFKRVPEKRNIYNYRVVIEGFEGRDSIP